LLQDMVANSQIYLLVLARIIGLIESAPLLSSESIPQMAKMGLALLIGIIVFPTVLERGYPIPQDGLAYALLVVAEALVGIIMGYFLVLIYAIFQTAGQFFSLQMGFGASEVFDPLAQIELPLMGQFLNNIAMLVLITSLGFQKTLFIGVLRSFESFRAVDLLVKPEFLMKTAISGLSSLFHQALIISLPILGTLFLVTLGMGLLAKAAPQMNLLTLGFPVTIIVAFLLLFLTMPFLIESFSAVIDEGFTILSRIITVGGSI